MGTAVVALPVNPAQLVGVLGSGFTVRNNDEAQTAEVECARFDDDELTSKLKGLRYDPKAEFPAAPTDKALNEATRAQAVVDAQERLSLAEENLAYQQEAVAYIDAAAAREADVVDPRITALLDAQAVLAGLPHQTSSDRVQEASLALQVAAQDLGIASMASADAQRAADSYRNAFLDEAKNRVEQCRAALDALTKS